MEAVEHAEESVLAASSHKVLDIIDDKHFYLHIEGKEIDELVVDGHCVHILYLELAGRHIKHHLFREALLDLQTYGLGQMSLAHTRSAENEQRIKRGVAR